MNVSARNTTQLLSSDIFYDTKSSESCIDSDSSSRAYCRQQRAGDSDSVDSLSSSTISDIEQNASYPELSIVNPFNFYSKYNYCPPGYLPQNISADIRSRTDDSRPSSTNSFTAGALTSATGDIFAAAAAAAAAASTSSAPTISSIASASSSSSGSASSGSTNPLRTALSNDSNIGGGSAGGSGSNPSTDDHLQRLAQMTHGVGILKSESDSSDATVANLAAAADVYQTAAAAAYAQAHAYGNWQNYYQFNNQMAPTAAAFPGWPGQCYPPSHWAQTKKGRQTYQRYQTSVLESKFQQSSYVSKKQREELRLQTNLTDRQIKIWFQNRRMKAKKEKNRCDEQTEHQTLIPANPPKIMLQGGSNNQHLQQNHLGGLIDDPLGLSLDQDKLKNNQNMLNGQHGQMWCSPVNMNGNNGMHGMVSMADSMAWPMLQHGQLHSQNPVTTNHPQYPMGYSLCPPNI